MQVNKVMMYVDSILFYVNIFISHVGILDNNLQTGGSCIPHIFYIITFQIWKGPCFFFMTRISMKFTDFFECFVILFASVVLIAECEINTILTVSLNFTAKSWIMVSSLLVPDLDRCLSLGHFIKKYSLVTYVLKVEL